MAEKASASSGEWASRKRPIREEMGFQRRMWMVQRLGWGLLALMLFAAFLGVFSQGPLSWTSTAGSGGGFSVHYERFYRSGAAASLDIQLEPAEGAAAERTLVLSPPLLEALSIETVHPAPLRAEAHPDGLHLHFGAAPSGGRVQLDIRPQRLGTTDGTITMSGSGSQARIWFLVYP